VGVAKGTVIKWIKSGRITAYNVHGRWRIPYSEVERLLGGATRRRMAIYARVSSSTQKGDLERQVESLGALGCPQLPQRRICGNH
jgi:Predicted site-specific integrase-resolvase